MKHVHLGVSSLRMTLGSLQVNDKHTQSVNHKPLLNPLNADLSPICHLLALLGAHSILHISKIRVHVHIQSQCDVQIIES